MIRLLQGWGLLTVFVSAFLRHASCVAHTHTYTHYFSREPWQLTFPAALPRENLCGLIDAGVFTGHMLFLSFSRQRQHWSLIDIVNGFLIVEKFVFGLWHAMLTCLFLLCWQVIWRVTHHYQPVMMTPWAMMGLLQGAELCL